MKKNDCKRNNVRAAVVLKQTNTKAENSEKEKPNFATLRYIPAGYVVV